MPVLVQELAVEHDLTSHLIRQAAGELGIPISADDEVESSEELIALAKQRYEEYLESRRTV